MNNELKNEVARLEHKLTDRTNRSFPPLHSMRMATRMAEKLVDLEQFWDDREERSELQAIESDLVAAINYVHGRLDELEARITKEAK